MPSNQKGFQLYRGSPEQNQIKDYLREYTILRVSDIVDLRGKTGDDNIRRSTSNSLWALKSQRMVDCLPFVDDIAVRPQTTKVWFLPENIGKESRYILRHDLQITLFHIQLKKLCDQKGLILHWHEQKIDHSREINPDAYFGIEDPSKPDGANVFHYFLEIERSDRGHYREGVPSIIRKLGKYRAYYNSDTCKKEWGFRRFRVIVSVTTAAKQLNLCKTLKQKFEHQMFWVTNEHAYMENIGGSIFLSPVDFDRAAYSF